MSDLLARIKAKKEAEKKSQVAVKPEERTPEPIPTRPDTEETRAEDAKADEELASELATDSQVSMRQQTTMTEDEYKKLEKERAVPDAEVIMGVTVEDLQERISHVFEHAKTAEKHEIKEDMDGLKRAIHSNPSIVQHLLPEDIGRMVGTLRKIHSEARKEAAQTPAKKKAAKSAESKAAKKLLSKPLSKEDMNDLLDEL